MTDPGTPASSLDRRTTLDRRSVLAGGAALVGLAAVTSLQPTAAHAATPAAAAAPSRLATTVSGFRSLAAVLAEAEGYAGTHLTEGPWFAHLGSVTEWSAVFTSWLLRDNGVTSTTRPVVQMERLRSAGRFGDVARPGALIFYHHGSIWTTYHVGLVSAVSGASIATIEADVPGQLPPGQTFVRKFGVPWSPQIVFGYPWYAGEA